MDNVIVGDLLKLTLFSRLYDVEMVNTFYARVEEVDDPSATLTLIGLSFFKDVIDTALCPCVINEVEYYNLKVEKFTAEPITFAFVSSELRGDRIAVGLPSLNSYGIKQNVTTDATRPGGKRFSGVPEDWSTGNALSQTAMTALIPLRNMLAYGFSALDVNDDPLCELRWIVYGDVITGVRPLPVWQYVRGATINPQVTSQVSRKK